MKSKTRSRKHQKGLRKQKKQNILEKQRKDKAVREAEDRLALVAQNAIFSGESEWRKNYDAFWEEWHSMDEKTRMEWPSHGKIDSLIEVLEFLDDNIYISEPIENWNKETWDSIGKDIMHLKIRMLLRDANVSIVDPKNKSIDTERAIQLCFRRPFHITMALVGFHKNRTSRENGACGEGSNDFTVVDETMKMIDTTMMFEGDVRMIREEISYMSLAIKNIYADFDDPEHPLSNEYFMKQLVTLVRLWCYEVFKEKPEQMRKNIEDYTDFEIKQWQDRILFWSTLDLQEKQSFINYRGFNEGRNKANFKLSCPSVINQLAMNPTIKNSVTDRTEYRVFIGQLMYAFATCRPDIASALFSLERGQCIHTNIFCLRVYLQTTKYCGIQYPRSQIFGTWKEEELAEEN